MDIGIAPQDILLAEAEEAVRELYCAAALSMPWLKDEDIGHYHPVMVMPGFLCGDQFTALMSYFLGSHGFSIYGWELNTIDDAESEAIRNCLCAHLRSLHDRYHKKVSLVAWGAGKTYVENLSDNCSDCIRQVILLELCIKPVKYEGDIQRLPMTSIQPISNWQDHPHHTGCVSRVPMISIFNELDQSVSWRCTNGEIGSNRENIDMFKGQCGRIFSPGILNTLLHCLTKPYWQLSTSFVPHSP